MIIAPLPIVMVIGILTLELFLPEPNSLKSKRMIIKRLIDRVRDRYNVSISEVDYHDLWQRALIGVAVVGNDRRVLNSVLDSVLDIVEQSTDIQVIDQRIELL